MKNSETRSEICFSCFSLLYKKKSGVHGRRHTEIVFMTAVGIDSILFASFPR